MEKIKVETVADIMALTIKAGSVLKNAAKETKYFLLTFTDGMKQELSEAVEEAVDRMALLGELDQDGFRGEDKVFIAELEGKTLIGYVARQSKKPVLLVFPTTHRSYIITQENADLAKRTKPGKSARAESQTNNRFNPFVKPNVN